MKSALEEKEMNIRSQILYCKLDKIKIFGIYSHSSNWAVRCLHIASRAMIAIILFLIN